MSNHVTQQADDVENNINQLEDTMHEAQQFRTLEEQVEDMKRRISERTQHNPSGYDIYVTGSLSTVVRTLADDTNFIPTGFFCIIHISFNSSGAKQL